MSRNAIINTLLAFVVFAGTLCGVELAFLILNRAEGVTLPYLLDNRTISQAIVRGTSYEAMDGLLGYARSEQEGNSLQSGIPFVYKDGFVFYGATASAKELSSGSLSRPIIVTLGGSTTEPRLDCWAEHLALLMKEKNISGTVVNGGVGGYSSNQELLKLLRDALELEPDVVLSYHGVKEVRWVTMPYPMTSDYMQTFLEKVLRYSASSTFFPNTVRYLRSHARSDGKRVTEVVGGYKTEKSHARYFLKNVRLMDAAAKEFGVAHISILQPFALVGNYASVVKREYPELHAKVVAEDSTLPMYEELFAIQKAQGIPLLDWTATFDHLTEKDPQIYRDRCHLTPVGNKIIAEKMYGMLLERGLIGK